MIAVNDPFFYDTAEPLGVWAQPNLDHLQGLMRRAFAKTQTNGAARGCRPGTTSFGIGHGTMPRVSRNAV
jgi:hypothetical protein